MKLVRLIFNCRLLLSNMDWGTWNKMKEIDRLVADTENSGVNPSYAWFSMLLPTTPEIQRRSMARIAERFKDIVPLDPPARKRPRPRIGYIGSKIDANHVTGTLFTHLFPHHNTDDFDIFIFLTRKNEESHNCLRLFTTRKVYCIPLDHYEDDKEAAEFIRTFDIDLLISTDGWNDNPRAGIVAHKPAHKQALWQGTATTSGAPWFDYVVVDQVIDNQPKGWRSEEAIMMPDSYYIAGHVKNELVKPPLTRKQYGLPEDKFLFINLNGTSKLNPETWERWMFILSQCPDSALVLVADKENVINTLKERTKGFGVDPDRIIFLPFVGVWDHVSRSGIGDLFLDTFYYGGHTTLAESLWMGVPAVTLEGATMSAKVGASMLHSVGLSELITRDRNTYAKTAIDIYNNPELLQHYKDRLNFNKWQSSIFDMDKQAKSIEDFVLSLR